MSSFRCSESQKEKKKLSRPSSPSSAKKKGKGPSPWGKRAKHWQPCALSEWSRDTKRKGDLTRSQKKKKGMWHFNPISLKKKEERISAKKGERGRPLTRVGGVDSVFTIIQSARPTREGEKPVSRFEKKRKKKKGGEEECLPGRRSRETSGGGKKKKGNPEKKRVSVPPFPKKRAAHGKKMRYPSPLPEEKGSGKVCLEIKKRGGEGRKFFPCAEGKGGKRRCLDGKGNLAIYIAREER